MADVQHKRGTRANLDALATANGLLVGQVYVISDENRIAIATAVGAYQAAAKEGEGDITDTTNVTAAGALMDSEVNNLAQVKAFDEADYATAAQGELADSALQPDESANLTAAYTSSVDPDGAQSSGTYTPTTAAGSNCKSITNGGAFPLAPPATATNTVTHLSLFIVNNASAGAITTSGFTKVAGDAFTTTDAHEFSCTIQVTDIGGTEYSSLVVLAMQ